MNDPNKIGLDISTTYDGKGATAARRDLGALEAEVNKYTAQTRNMASASDAANNAWGRQESALAELDEELGVYLSQADKAYRAQRMLDTGNDLLYRSLKAGLITQQQHDTLLARLAEKYGAAATGAMELGRGANMSAREMATLGRAIASGNFEQAAQTAGVVGARVGGIGIAGFAAAAGITAVVAGIGLLVAEQERYERSLSKVNGVIGFTGRQAGMARAEVAELIAELSRLPGMDREGATGVVGAAGGVGGLSGEQLRRTTMLTRDFAAATGMEAAQAAKTLAEAVREPEKRLRELDDRYGFLTASQRGAVEGFLDAGNKAGALELALTALEGQVKGTAERGMTPLQRSTDALGNSWDKFKTSVGESDGLKTVNTLLIAIVGSAKWLVDNASAFEKAVPWWIRDPLPMKALRAAMPGEEVDPTKYTPEEQARLNKVWADAARREAERSAVAAGNRELQGVVDQAGVAKYKADQAKAIVEAKRIADDWHKANIAIVEGEAEFIREMSEALSFVPANRKRMDERAYWENMYGADVTMNRTTEEMREYHKQYMAALEAGQKFEYQQMRVNAGFDAERDKTGAAAEQWKELKDAVQGYGRETSRALAQAAVDGKVSFDTLSDAARGFVATLLEMQIQRSVMDPLLKGATSFLGNYIGGAGGSDYHDANAADVDHGGSGPGDVRPQRYLHPAVFAFAPRAHRGIGPRERPVVITDDESVLTPGQMRALGGMGSRSVKVEIINPPGQQLEAASVEPRFDAIEGLVVRVIMRDQREGGPVTRGFGSVYGLRRRGGAG